MHAIKENWIKRFRRHATQDKQGRFSIRARSIYILPTKQGMLLAIVLILMLIGSVNFGSNLGYLVTFLLGGIWLSSILHTWRNLLALQLTSLQAPAVFAGQDAGFDLLLENPGDLPRFGLMVQASTGNTAAIDLQGNESRTITITLPTSQRGEFKLSVVSIHSRYPFGLFKAWTYIQLDMTCLVYPRPATQGEPPSQPAYSPSEAGERGVGADDFIGLRAFRHGDSPRHIDWKAMARERGLYSKLFGGDRAEKVSIDWDLLTEPDPENRLRQLSRFILMADERQQHYSLTLPGLTIPAGLDESHRNHCLAALARFKVIP